MFVTTLSYQQPVYADGLYLMKKKTPVFLMSYQFRYIEKSRRDETCYIFDQFKKK
ncbi:hypothetical protein OSO01_45240 [Oceanobacillus sojae]|uniref:Uncharacterized protein n=1 Tax=Oceanobacillus sojae TaxID=582851 RepID=A0A511ZQQ6_9BACI|nr:hypothetical protein OSO01_45240 [Oceanobacillus sojae]